MIQIPISSHLQQELCHNHQPAENKTIASAVVPSKLQYVYGVKKENAMKVPRETMRDFGGNCLISVMITLTYAR